MKNGSIHPTCHSNHNSCSYRSNKWCPAKTDFILPPSMSSMCLSGIHFHQGSPLEHAFLPLSTTGIAFVKLVGEGSGQFKGSAGGQYSSSPKAFALQLIFGPLDPFQHLCAAASNQGPSSSGIDGTVCNHINNQKVYHCHHQPAQAWTPSAVSNCASLTDFFLQITIKFPRMGRSFSHQ
jgi:hypothetical protein